jgi:hypothetical protein
MSKQIFLMAVVGAVRLLSAQEYAPTCRMCPGTWPVPKMDEGMVWPKRST